MNITMTWGDVVLSLAVGVVGSLVAAYLFVRLPRFWNACAQWLARRSQKSALRRMKKLRAELGQVKRFRSDPTKYYGWMFDRLSHVQTSFSMGLAQLVLAALALGGAVSTKSYPLFILGIVMGGAGMAALIQGNYLRNGLGDLRDLDRREAELRREIAELQTPAAG
jgi:hypothetical protein